MNNNKLATDYADERRFFAAKKSLIGVNLRINLLCGSVLLASVSGCSMQPTYQRPALPVAAAWTSPATGTKAVADLAHYFPDARLQALITVALENNRDLRIAAARIVEAQAQYGIQRGDQLPNVSLNAGRTASLTPASASITGNKLNTQRNDVNIGLVTYELDFWGRVSSLSEAAKASYLSTEAAQRAFRLSLINDVASVYLSVLELRERTELTQNTLSGREQARNMAERRYVLGAAAELDKLQAEGAYQSVLAEQANLQRQLAAAENLLDMLLGKSVASLTDLPAGRTLAEQGIQADALAGLPSEVLLQRPDVLAAEQRLVAANANIGAARAAFFPRVSLTGNYGTASRSFAGLFAAGSNAWSFQPLLTLPLFDGGRNSANLDVSKARQVIAVAEYEKTIQQAFREVSDLLAARDKLAEQLTAQTANSQAQQQRLKLVEARYQAGVSNYLEVLDGQRDAYAAEQATLQIHRAYLTAVTQLYKALAVESGAATPISK
jgi:multidrug efflux system outer membrane protein